MQAKVAQVEKIETMLPSMLVSATYDGISKLAVLKFYEPTAQKLFFMER
jgi:DNA polymerase I